MRSLRRARNEQRRPPKVNFSLRSMFTKFISYIRNAGKKLFSSNKAFLFQNVLLLQKHLFQKKFFSGPRAAFLRKFFSRKFLNKKFTRAFTSFCDFTRSMSLIFSSSETLSLSQMVYLTFFTSRSCLVSAISNRLSFKKTPN